MKISTELFTSFGVVEIFCQFDHCFLILKRHLKDCESSPSVSYLFMSVACHKFYSATMIKWCSG